MYRTRQVKSVLTNVYFNSRPMEERDYIRGRNFFVVDGCCSNGVLALTSGAFLSGYASSLGASDSLNGIVGSIPTLVCVVQLFSSVVLENLKEKKFIIALLAFLHRALLGLMFFIPFMVEGQLLRLGTVIGLYFVSHICGTFIGTGAGNWIMQLVPPERLGNYLGIRDAIGLATTTALTLIMGQVLDFFRARGNAHEGFLIIGTAVLAIAFLNFFCLSTIKEPQTQQKERKVQLKDVFFEPLKNKRFRKIIIFYMFWNLSLQIAAPFFSVYMVTGLNLNYTYITLIGLIASASRVGAAAIWGKLADRKSWLWMTRMSMLVLGGTHFGWLFMTESTYMILQPVLQLTSGIAWGGIALSVFNLQYIFAPAESRVMYVGANTAFAGVCGFLSTLLGAALLAAIKPIDAMGMTFSSMQVLFAISGILIVFCVVYVKKILEKA